MSRATRHSIYLILAYIANSALNYAFGVLLSWFFTPAQFGVLGVAQSLLLLTALVAGSGFAWTVAHDVAAGRLTQDTRRRFRAAWVANVVLGLFMGTGLWVAYEVDLLSLGAAYQYVVPLISLTVVLLAARAVFNGVARGLYRFGSVAVNLVGEVLIKLAAGLGFVAAGLGVAGVMAGFVVGAAVSLLHSWWITRSAHMWRGKGWVDARVIRNTVPLFASLLGTALMLNLDILGLRFLSPVGQADQLSGYYQAAAILSRTPVYLAQALTLVLFSYVSGAQFGSRYAAEKSPDYVGAAARSWFRFLVPAGLVLVVAPQTALALFFPPAYQNASAALRIAALGGLSLALFNMLSGVLQAGWERRRPAVAAGIATVVQILVLIGLVPRWEAIGAAFSLVAAGITGLIMLMPTFRSRLTQPLALAGEKRKGLRCLQLALPLVAMALPLVLLPDGGRVVAVLKLGLAGLGYVVVLLGIRRETFDFRQPVPDLLLQFVQVVIGG